MHFDNYCRIEAIWPTIMSRHWIIPGLIKLATRNKRELKYLFPSPHKRTILISQRQREKFLLLGIQMKALGANRITY